MSEPTLFFLGQMVDFQHIARVLSFLGQVFTIWWFQFSWLAVWLWLLGITSMSYLEARDRRRLVAEYMVAYHGVPPTEYGIAQIRIPNEAAKWNAAEAA